ncbi:zinc finger BED domain-containing protein 4-like [Cyprinus carpio]|uniref:Zinc finger BED domain-containing protein 4-like n=1 Tax=Cyprinus carpio TaxID=7962 RepID=A0A9Q9XXG4_CYPCA|nr:zinc finger BED domain-containing protein 4-like [Cyprinus carpio]
MCLMKKKSVKWCTITKAVSYHIAKDMVPVATVEQVGFQKLLKTMDPRYELPSRNYFAREALPKLYTEIRQSLADRLADVTHFALTSDMWSSRTCEPYMSLRPCRTQLQAGNSKKKYLVAITTDNGSNIVKAVELNEWLRMQCFGHRLHLAIGHGMNDKRVTRAISLCKRIVSCFSYSWKKRRHLAEVQIQLGLPSHQLITESATPWGSRQQMIERVLEQEGALASPV